MSMSGNVDSQEAMAPISYLPRTGNDDMAMNPYHRIAQIIRWILLSLALLVVWFSLVSGAENGSLGAILHNAPNSYPWFILLILVILTWRWPYPAGIALLTFGIGLVTFFNFLGPNFWWTTFFVTSAIPLLALVFLWAVHRSQRNLS